MSRAPKVEPGYAPLHASLCPKDVIDFVDNSLQTLAPGVMGGPPAYLEAHGIRYVPATELGADPGGLVSMSTGAPQAAPRAERVALNSRIREFLQAEDPRADYAASPRGMRASFSGGHPSERMPRYTPSHDSHPRASSRSFTASAPRSAAPRGHPASAPRFPSHSAHTATSERLLAELKEQAQSGMGPPPAPGVASRMRSFDY
jgi:hypothetical protein